MPLHSPRTRRPIVALASVAALAGAMTLAAPSASAGSSGHATNAYVQTNLVSDVPGMAQVTDPNLRNPWGVAFSATSPLWSANERTATSTLYNGAVAGSPAGKVALTVTTPARPAGVVFNS